MKLFAVRDDTDPHRKDLAYLFYYESENSFISSCLPTQTHGRPPFSYPPLQSARNIPSVQNGASVGCAIGSSPENAKT